jgi:hypothetical protein
MDRKKYAEQIKFIFEISPPEIQTKKMEIQNNTRNYNLLELFNGIILSGNYTVAKFQNFLKLSNNAKLNRKLIDEEFYPAETKSSKDQILIWEQELINETEEFFTILASYNVFPIKFLKTIFLMRL